jgi:hypothetical protein
VGKKKRKRISSEEWAEIEARTDRTLRMLQSRIDYHTAKLREEHGPDYRIPHAGGANCLPRGETEGRVDLLR